MPRIKTIGLGAVAAVFVLAAPFGSASGATAGTGCPVFAHGQEVGRMSFAAAREISGLAASRRNPGVLWVHNDSGDTQRIFAVAPSGRLLGTFVVSTRLQVDWEDIAVGPGPTPGASYLYIGDIGGNSGRHSVTVFRAPEPSVSASGVPEDRALAGVVALKTTYPGSERYNAETLLVDPRTPDIYVVTKSKTQPQKVFRYPAARQNASVVYPLELVTQLQLPGEATGGDFSPDGSEILIKGYSWGQLYRRGAAEPTPDAFRHSPCSVPTAWGEAAGYAADSSGYYMTNEGSFKPIFRFARTAAVPVAPGAPTDLQAAAANGTRVDVAWKAPGGEAAPAGYKLYRDGAPLATTTTPTYADGNVEPGTRYAYEVRAFDARGGLSAAAGPALATTPPLREVITVTPSDDASLSGAVPSANYGASAALEGDADPVQDFLLKFTLSGIGTRKVASVKLRLYCVNPAPQGGTIHRAAESSWTEQTVSWNGAPAAGDSLASLGRVAAGSWYEVDVTPLVSGDGSFSLRVANSSPDGADYSSKEGSHAPQLVVTLAE